MHVRRDGEGRSIRVLRVGERIRHILADLLSRDELGDPRLAAHRLSVTQARMTPDLRHAQIFIMPLGGEGAQDALQALRDNRKRLRSEVARHAQLKYAPELHFDIDQSFEAAQKIDDLLRSSAVARDLDMVHAPQNVDEDK